jgi:hypothetical protein
LSLDCRSFLGTVHFVRSFPYWQSQPSYKTFIILSMYTVRRIKLRMCL